jgi:DNA-binding NarL/FixJ family response regulator
VQTNLPEEEELVEIIRVLLVDDHALFREGLGLIIASQPDMMVIGEASDGLEAAVKAVELKPDLILMDIQMPGMNGIEATCRIKREFPSVTIVMLTVRDDEEKLFDAIKNGAQGYLLKQMQSKELIEMLRRAMAGEVAVPPRLAGQMLEEFRRLSQLLPQESGELVALSSRELDVLNQVALGKTDKEIAQTLALSIHTVKTHLRSILTKLQVGGRKEAVRLAKGKGMIEG